MDFIVEFLFEMVFELIIGGSIEVLKSKKTSWIAKTICLVIWVEFFGVLFWLVISIIRGPNRVAGYMFLGIVIFVLIGISCNFIKWEE